MSNATAFFSEAARWLAVQGRDANADGHFFYAVITTGVYCYPSCPSRRALRENVSFHDNREAAEAAGFVACQRCKPEGPPLAERHANLVASACRLLEYPENYTVAAVAEQLDVSRYHLQRVFQDVTGVSPKRYQQACRLAQTTDQLRSAGGVTDAVLQSGFDARSTFYNQTSKRLGMLPSVYRAGAPGLILQWSIVSTSLGYLLVAASDKGICAVQFGESRDELQTWIGERFSEATLQRNDEALAVLVEKVVQRIEQGEQTDAAELPLDVSGTVFQERVWQALCGIPAGSTWTYQEVATAIGDGKAVRAVASACAANPTAVVIPCHRVVRKDGQLSGYRWGVRRKAALLQREGADVAEPRPVASENARDE